MKLTTFSLLLLCIAYVQGCIENDIAEEGCSDAKYIAIIACIGDECTCKPSDEPDCSSITSEDMVALTADILNGAKCEEICLASDDCVFFRWDKYGSVDSHCTLMNKDQCDGWHECHRGQCVSGQAGCHGHGTEPPLPDSAQCMAGVVFVPGAVHWNCRFETEDINIYEKDATVPTGTICQTAHKCAAFAKGTTDDTGNSFANHLVVECNPDRDEATFLWGKADQCLYEVPEGPDGAIATNKASLIDPVCITEADPLVLSAGNLYKPGVSLVCENAFTTDMEKDEVTVTGPNACVLLCNFHHTFSFESELALDGTGVWNKYDVGSDVPVVLKPEEVKCWDFMKR